MPKCALCGREVNSEKPFQRDGKVYCSANCLVEDREIDGYRRLFNDEMNYKKKIILLLVLGCPFIFIAPFIAYLFRAVLEEITLTLLTITLVIYLILFLREWKNLKKIILDTQMNLAMWGLSVIPLVPITLLNVSLIFSIVTDTVLKNLSILLSNIGVILCIFSLGLLYAIPFIYREKIRSGTLA